QTKFTAEHSLLAGRRYCVQAWYGTGHSQRPVSGADKRYSSSRTDRCDVLLPVLSTCRATDRTTDRPPHGPFYAHCRVVSLQRVWVKVDGCSFRSVRAVEKEKSL